MSLRLLRIDDAAHVVVSVLTASAYATVGDEVAIVSATSAMANHVRGAVARTAPKVASRVTVYVGALPADVQARGVELPVAMPRAPQWETDGMHATLPSSEAEAVELLKAMVGEVDIETPLLAIRSPDRVRAYCTLQIYRARAYAERFSPPAAPAVPAVEAALGAVAGALRSILTRFRAGHVFAVRFARVPADLRQLIVDGVAPKTWSAVWLQAEEDAARRVDREASLGLDPDGWVESPSVLPAGIDCHRLHVTVGREINQLLDRGGKANRSGSGFPSDAELARILLAARVLRALRLHVEGPVEWATNMGALRRLEEMLGSGPRAALHAILDPRTPQAPVWATGPAPAAAPAPAWDGGRDLLTAWKAVLQDQGVEACDVLMQRSGLTTAYEGAKSGPTSSRHADQIEQTALHGLRRNAVWVRVIGARLDGALRDGAVLLDELATDPWWTNIVEHPAALDYIGHHVFGDACRVVVVGKRSYLARCEQEVLDDAKLTLNEVAKGLSFPMDLTEFRSTVMRDVHQVGRVLMEALWDQLAGRLLSTQVGNHVRILGFRTSAAQSVFCYHDLPGWADAAAEIRAEGQVAPQAVDAAGAKPVTMLVDRVTPDLVYDLAMLWIRHAPTEERIAVEQAARAAVPDTESRGPQGEVVRSGEYWRDGVRRDEAGRRTTQTATHGKRR